MEEIILYLTSLGKEVEILCFTETWLNDSHENPSLNPNGYNIAPHDRIMREIQRNTSVQ